MKRVSTVLVLFLGFALAACQREAPRAADAGSAGAPVATPAPAVAPAMPEATPVPVGQPGGQAEATRPAPAREAPVTQAAPAMPVAAAPATQPAAPTPAPTPVPTPTPRPRIVASGTALPIVLQQALSTKTAQAEDPVLAGLAEDVSVEGDVLLPSGSELRGHVVSALRSGRVKGRARLVVAFDEIRVDGRSYKIEATGFDVTAGSSKGKDAKIAGGAAAAGVLIGAIADGGSGAAKGGLIGGAAGGAAVLATRGVEVELASGSRYTIKLQKSLRLR